MTSNKVFVTYERSTCSKSNLLAAGMHTFEFRRFRLASAYKRPAGHFESVQMYRFT